MKNIYHLLSMMEVGDTEVEVCDAISTEQVEAYKQTALKKLRNAINYYARKTGKRFSCKFAKPFVKVYITRTM